MASSEADTQPLLPKSSLPTSDDAAKNHRRRNRKLSAFYGLDDRSPDSNLQITVATPVARQEPLSDTEAALKYARDLIERAPLEQLLRASTELRNSRDDSYRALHGSVQRCYDQLLETANAARDVKILANELRSDVSGSLAAIRTAAQNAEDANRRLQPSRDSVDKLEGARKASLLLQAAQILKNEIPDSYREIVELCLDPEQAKRKLQLAVQRYATLRPVFVRLSKESVDFENALETIQSAANGVRADIEERMNSGSGTVEGLELMELIQLRLLLGDSAVDLKHAFLRTAHMNLTATSPPQAGIVAASSNSLALSAYLLSFSSQVTVPAIVSICNSYYETFVDGDTRPDDSEASQVGEFTVWLAGLADVCIGSKVRKALTEFQAVQLNSNWQLSDETDSGAVEDHLDGFGRPEDASRFIGELNGLTLCLDGQIEDLSGSAHVHLRDIIRAICDELRTCFSDSARTRAQARLYSKIDNIFYCDYVDALDSVVDADVDRLVRLTFSTQDTLDSLLGVFGDRKIRPLVQDVVIYTLEKVDAWASPDGNIDSTTDVTACSRSALCAAVIFHSLSKSRDATLSGLGGQFDLRSIRGQLLQKFSVRVVSQLTDILRGRIHELGEDATHISSASPSKAGCRAASVLRSAQLDATTILFGKDGMQVAIVEEDDVLGEDSVVQRICVAWVSLVREETFQNDRAVHSLQVDAALLGRAVQLPGAFDAVIVAAVERCLSNVVLLDARDVEDRIALV